LFLQETLRVVPDGLRTELPLAVGLKDEEWEKE
jgi:hypothetical protein